MSNALLKSSGSQTGVGTVDINVLDGHDLLGPSNGTFFADFWIKGIDANGAAQWQVHNGTSYANIGSGVSGLNDTEFISDQALDNHVNANGQVRLNSTGTGEVDYFVALRLPGLPTYLSGNGSVGLGLVREIYMREGFDYSFRAEGTFTWEYYDGAAWQAFTNGTDSAMVATIPPGGRVRLNATAASTFSFAIQRK